MSDMPVTRSSLLVRLRDPQDTAAWNEFVQLYAPVVYQFARNRGLQDADAADLTQIVFQEILKEMPRLDYDPQKGLFRGWLFRVVHNQLCKMIERDKRSPRGTGLSSNQQLLDEQPDRADSDAEAELWEQEYQRQVFLLAVERLKCQLTDSSWQAFWLMAVEGKSAHETAEALGLTVGAVYTAKSRVLERIKKEVQLMQAELE
jgi:RNA polymerase sigma factor (sigma-70 family)